jgi:L-seryl-tRNA(Ser) seleniumtransferase
LVEVGTTNRTRIDDFATAINNETALMLRVHTSNYRIVGFAEEVELEDMVELGKRRGLIVADDLGSGAFLSLSVFAGEPSVAASLRAGVDVVCFSGDKLLGGPQAGILLGRREVIDRLRRHPVSRALRMDKMGLAALEATLQLYLDPEKARREIPTLRVLQRTPADAKALADKLQTAIEVSSGDGFVLEVVESVARAGGGSMPLEELPSYAVRIRTPELPPDSGLQISVTAIEEELRRAPVPVVARVFQDSLHLDVLALEEDEIPLVADSVAWVAQRAMNPPRQA